MTVTDPALAADDIEQVTGERPERVGSAAARPARRRTFTAQDKLDVVAEYDAAPAGEKAAVLRREGPYSSHVIQWRRARDPARWLARRGRGAVRRRNGGTRRSPG